MAADKDLEPKTDKGTLTDNQDQGAPFVTPGDAGGNLSPNTAAQADPGKVDPATGRYATGVSNITAQGYDDPWSTVTPDKQAAPTGGAAGTYAKLASGEMSPLQQGAGYGYGQVAQGGPYAGIMSGLIQNQAAKSVGDPLSQIFGVLQGQYNNQSTPEQDQMFGYQRMVGDGGYDAATKSAISNESNNAITAQYQGLADQLQNAAARTGSPIGEFAALSQASQNAGNQRNAAARQNQVLFANEAERQKEAGLSGLGQNAQLGQARQGTAAGQYLQAQANQAGQTQANAQLAAQMANQQTQQTLQGSNGLAQLAAQLSGQQQAGAAGLANLDQLTTQQQNQLYSMLASVLGTKQEDYTSLAQTTGSVGI